MDCKVVQNYVVTPIKLGEGCFGIVYRGYVKNNKNQLLAVKTIPLQNIKNQEVIKRQIEILLKLKSPNIVKFYKPAKTKKHLYFFLQYCQQDLKSYVKSKGGKLSQAQVIDILQQICNGFKVVHKNNVIHRDIKPANFLIHKGVIKISDFGFARTVNDVDEVVFLTFLGSPLYMAPQILAKQKFSSKCDIWSLGVTLYEILYGKPPYNAKNPAQLLANIRNNKVKFPQNIKRSQQLQNLLLRMLTIQEEDRISWTQLFEHPLVKQNNNLQTKNQQSADNLIKSYNSAKTYLSRNKVVTKTTKALEDQGQEEGLKSQIKSIAEEGKEDFANDVKAQQEQIKQMNKIQQIDELMRYKRNVSVFLNVQCNGFFSTANQVIDQLYFYMGLYLLLSQQISIHSQLKKQLLSGKPLQKVQQDIWITYLKSSAHSRITKLVQCDLKHLETYFNEVKNRLSSSLKDKKNADNKSAILSSFVKYFNSKEGFDSQNYEIVMTQLIKMISTKIKDKNLIIKLRMTIKPFKYLDKNLDFGLFYESEQEELEKIVQKFGELKG